MLPFAGSATDSELDYLREGIAESLMNRLSGIAGLRVVSRDSAFRHRSQTANEAGRLLGVRGVVAGAIRKVDGELLVSAELVDASADQRLWGEEFHCKDSDVMSTRDDIAGKIAGQLRVQLGSGSPAARGDRAAQPAAARETADSGAHDLYLRGRFLTSRLAAQHVRQGLEYLKQAVRLDPNFALAHAAIAEAHLFLADLHQPAMETLPGAKTAAARAVEISPTLAEAHVAAALVQAQGDLNWSGAEASLRRAIDLNPNLALAHGWLGWVLAWAGRREEGLAASRRSTELEPRSPLAQSLLAANLYFAWKYTDSFSSAGKALEIDPLFPLALYWRGLAMSARGTPPAVVAAKLETLSGGDSAPPVLAVIARAHATRGSMAKAREALAALTKTAQAQHVSATLFAGVYAAMRDKKSALGWLERAYDTRARLLMWTRLDPVYEELRGEARFKALLAKLNV